MIRISSCVVAALLFGTACETVRCPDGMAFPPGGGDCALLEDAGVDAGIDAGIDAGTSDAGEDGGGGPDAGPCGMACPPASPFCDLATGSCVECRDDADCSDPAAVRCDVGVCVGCDASDQCSGVTGAEVCDAATETCVECTAAETGACGGNPCTSANTCSMFAADRLRCASCDTDANCAETNNFCVPNSADPPVGHCLLELLLPAGCTRPLTNRIDGRTTLSGVAGRSFCGVNEAVTTCEAVGALLGGVMCPGGTDAECPDGGLCRTVGTLPRHCTYQCVTALDCPPLGDTSFCTTPTVDPTYCGGPRP